MLFAAGATSVCCSPSSAADDESATVEDVVTYKGKPVPEATITIHLKDDQFVGSKIKEGKYRIDRVPSVNSSSLLNSRSSHYRSDTPTRKSLD
jgi:hypothetical protein